VNTYLGGYSFRVWELEHVSVLSFMKVMVEMPVKTKHSSL